MSAYFTYDIIAEDPTTHARAGVLHTTHGDIPTPIFMPVGTKGTVKGLLMDTVASLGTKILLANTYHLAMRPGAETVAELGGLHDFMQWHGPILTDSGGFQVFSHGNNVKLSDDGVRFRTVDYDGSYVTWTPEENMRIQQLLGADIVMQLDQCVGYPTERGRALELVGGALLEGPYARRPGPLRHRPGRHAPRPAPALARAPRELRKLLRLRHWRLLGWGAA